MDQLIPGLAALVEPFRDVFHPRVFATFQALLAGWIICLGPRTLSEVWQATGWAAERHHDTAYAVFHSAVWEWDDLGLILVTLILTHLIPGGVVWLVVDDALCHKRGAKVAFGGIFLDAVLSSRRHKTFRFGLNWVVLGIAVPVPLRPDRYFCLPVLWRLCRKKGTAGHLPHPQAAAEQARRLALADPGRTFWLVGDSAYVNAALLQGRPANLQVIGPLHWKAALYAPPAPPKEGQRGRRRKKGERLPAPGAMIEDTVTYPAEVLEIAFPKVTRALRVQVVRGVLWYRGCKTEPVMVVLVRDPSGQWRDEALVVTDASVSARFAILGYCRRWSVELCFFDSKQFLGLHDPQVWSARSAERPTRWRGSSVRWWCSGTAWRVMRVRTWSATGRGTRRSRRRSATCSGRYGSRCGSTRFLESPARRCPHRNLSGTCSTGYRLSLEVRKPSPRRGRGDRCEDLIGDRPRPGGGVACPGLADSPVCRGSPNESP